MFRNLQHPVAAIVLTVLIGMQVCSCSGGNGNSVATPAAELNPVFKFEPQPARNESITQVIARVEAATAPQGVNADVFEQLKQALVASLAKQGNARVSSVAPSGDAGRVTDIFVGGGVLRWTYESRGDTDANGEVNISDLTPLGVRFGASTHDGVGDIKDAWVDTDSNGEINISDVTPIGMNFWANCAGYQVLTADDLAGPHTELGEVLFADAVVGGFPPAFEYVLPGGLLAYVLVQPFDDAGQLGELSIAVPSGGGGSQHYLDGAEEELAADSLPDLPIPDIVANDVAFDDHPQGTGLPTSRTRINLILAPGTTVAEANAVLNSINARIIGALPEIELLLIAIPDDGTFDPLHGALDTLELDPSVGIAVEDTLLGEAVLSHPTDAEDPVAGWNAHPGEQSPNPWKWDLPPSESLDLNGNWGMEAIRAPQAWNLTTYGLRGSGVPGVMVTDTGFNDVHADGEMANIAFYTHDGTSMVQQLVRSSHGMHVAGTVGAEHFNQVGVAGVNPLLSWETPASETFVGNAIRSVSFNYGEPYDSRASAFSSIMADIFAALRGWPDTQVMNLSLCYNWYKSNPLIDPNTDADAQDVCIDHGALFRLAAHLYSGKIFSVAAGNDSGATHNYPEEIEARWASPMCWAALDPAPSPLFGLVPAPNIIVVEAADSVIPNIADPANAWQYTKSDFSNMGGHVAAPGSHIMSCVGDNMVSGWTAQENYETYSGTSMAAPHVTGLINYLGTLDDSLTAAELVTLVTADEYTTELVLDAEDTAPAIGPVNDRMIDAFASVIGIDTIKGNRAVQIALVDVDDGTRDGNLRTMVLNDAGYFWPADPSPDEVHTSDDRRGAGYITMRDFRVFRDAYVAAHHAEFPLGLDLDGPASHFKHDLNFDGAVHTGGANGVACNPSHPVDIPDATVLDKVPGENLYPRYDFNGDGEVGNWAATAPYRVDPATPAGTNSMEATVAAPGMLRDIDVMMTTGTWQKRDWFGIGLFQKDYWENVSVSPVDEGGLTIDHWSPARYLLGNRDATAAVDAAYRNTPDYLHSADIHFWIDWGYIALQMDYLDITVTSEIDGVLPAFTRTGRFYPDDAKKFVLTVPIWGSSVHVEWVSNSSYSGNTDVTVALGSDATVGISNVVMFPERRWEIPELILPWREPVFWIKSFGPGEGYSQRSVMVGEYQAGLGHDLRFVPMINGEPEGVITTIATLLNPQQIAGGDYYGNPAVVATDGEGNLWYYHSSDNGNTWDTSQLLDNGMTSDELPVDHVSLDDEQFVFFSKESGAWIDSLYYVRISDTGGFQFSMPVEIGIGIQPSAAIINGELQLAYHEPGSAQYLKLMTWNPGSAMFESNDLDMNAMPPDPPEFNFELFDNNGYFGITALADGVLYFVGLDGSGRFSTEIVSAPLPDGYEFKDWVRPQPVIMNGKVGCYFRGNFWLSGDAFGREWPNGHIEPSWGGYNADPDFARLRSSDEMFTVQFYAPDLNTMVISTQELPTL